MSDALRSKIIRLAHQNPELRPHLMPLITKTAVPRSVEFMAAKEAMNDAIAYLGKAREEAKKALRYTIEGVQQDLGQDHQPLVQDITKINSDLDQFLRAQKLPMHEAFEALVILSKD